jgi:HAE1 family hydrophobic/amphiphilic exporter-1
MGEELRLKDVADLELGQSDYAYSNRINGHPGVMGSVSQVAGSNATRINQDIDKLIEEVEQTMPKDIRIVTFDNTNDFLFASIREVVFTLLLAIVLVLIVVYLFVQDFRATLIPALGIIVSLIGTFAFMVTDESGRIDFVVSREPSLLHQLTHHSLCHWRTADITKTNKENPFHARVF